MNISTVKIATPETESGFMIINEDAFDPAVHQLWGEGVGMREAEGGRPLDQMTLAELREYAKGRGLSIPAAITAKADVLAHILASGNAPAPVGSDGGRPQAYSFHPQGMPS